MVWGLALLHKILVTGPRSEAQKLRINVGKMLWHLTSKCVMADQSSRVVSLTWKSHVA